MQIIPAKTPGFIKTLFPSFVWNISTHKKELYLTFDDGPTPEVTDWVLSTLKAYNAKATFFCIGNNIEKHPEIFQRVFAEGHSIGNHTFNHLKGWKHKTKAYINDTEKTEELINLMIKNHLFKAETEVLSTHEKHYINPKLFRPPYGKFKAKQSQILRDLNYKIIMWDVLSYDWDRDVTRENCYKNITSGAKEGSIIVFHDSIKASRNLMYTLPKILDFYANKGFKFKSI